MSLRINDVAPDFKIDTTQGEIEFHNWIGEGWAILFSHPKDFTPVCTTELGALAELESDFISRNTKVIGLSVDPVENHIAWLDDIAEVTGFRPNYPLIADTELRIAKLYDMLPASIEGSCVGRTAADNQTVRSVFIIGPDKKIKLHLSYPMATGRNFKELLRIIDSLQLTVNHKLATPANWTKGEDVIIVPAVKNEEAESLFPNGWRTVKPYIRLVSDPSTN